MKTLHLTPKILDRSIARTLATPIWKNAPAKTIVWRQDTHALERLRSKA